MIPDFKCIVLTTNVRKTPHLEGLCQHNPELTIDVESVEETGHSGWYNCDRNIVNWWKKNRDTQTHNRFLFLEYDVKVTSNLTTLFPDTLDVEVMGYNDIDFPCFAEASKLSVYDIGACRISPLAVVLLSREVLDSICKPEMDKVFSDQIYCEVRIASVIKYFGYPITVNDKLNEDHGIKHPVK